MLEFLGHQVLVASSGPEALNVLQGDSTFDLVITDHAMPQMTGSDLADPIAASARTCKSSSRLDMPSFRAPKKPDCPGLANRIA